MDDGDDDDTDDDDTDDDTDDDHDDDTDDDNDHKNDSYNAAGAAPGASVPCSFSRVSVEGKGPVVSSETTWESRVKRPGNLEWNDLVLQKIVRTA